MIFTCLAMAVCVVFLLALYRTFSGLPVPFCIDLAVSKCLEQKKYTFYPKITRAVQKKIYTSCFMLVMAARFSMASCLAPKLAKSSVRHHFQLTFHSQATKEGFLSRLDRVKLRLFSGGGKVDKYCLLTSLLDLLEGRLSGLLRLVCMNCILCSWHNVMRDIIVLSVTIIEIP